MTSSENVAVSDCRTHPRYPWSCRCPRCRFPRPRPPPGGLNLACWDWELCAVEAGFVKQDQRTWNDHHLTLNSRPIKKITPSSVEEWKMRISKSKTETIFVCFIDIKGFLYYTDLFIQDMRLRMYSFCSQVMKSLGQCIGRKIPKPFAAKVDFTLWQLSFCKTLWIKYFL